MKRCIAWLLIISITLQNGIALAGNEPPNEPPKDAPYTRHVPSAIEAARLARAAREQAIVSKIEKTLAEALLVDTLMDKWRRTAGLPFAERRALLEKSIYFLTGGRDPLTYIRDLLYIHGQFNRADTPTPFQVAAAVSQNIGTFWAQYHLRAVAGTPPSIGTHGPYRSNPALDTTQDSNYADQAQGLALIHEILVGGVIQSTPLLDRVIEEGAERHPDPNLEKEHQPLRDRYIRRANRINAWTYTLLNWTFAVIGLLYGRSMGSHPSWDIVLIFLSLNFIPLVALTRAVHRKTFARMLLDTPTEGPFQQLPALNLAALMASYRRTLLDHLTLELLRALNERVEDGESPAAIPPRQIPAVRQEVVALRAMLLQAPNNLTPDEELDTIIASVTSLTSPQDSGGTIPPTAPCNTALTNVRISGDAPSLGAGPAEQASNRSYTEDHSTPMQAKTNK